MNDKQESITAADQQWIDEQDKNFQHGSDIVGRASDEALEYMADAVENINDRAWRKMTVSTQALEMGIGAAFAEHLVPAIYNAMERGMTKKLKLRPSTARALKEIYIGRVIKNIQKELSNGN